jgi:hypothetical protein
LADWREGGSYSLRGGGETSLGGCFTGAVDLQTSRCY